MKGIFKKPGKRNFYFRFRKHGRQIKVSLGTEDEAEAIVVARRILQAPELEDVGGARSELEFYFAAQRKDDRLSANTISARSFVLFGFFKMTQRPIAAVTSHDVQKWYDGLTSVEEGTRQLYVRWLRAFFKFLMQRNRVRDNPVNGIVMARTRPKARKSFLSREQVAKLIDSCECRQLKFILFCGFHAGMRKDEVVEARPEWFHIHGDAPFVHIGPTDAIPSLKIRLAPQGQGRAKRSNHEGLSRFPPNIRPTRPLHDCARCAQGALALSLRLSATVSQPPEISRRLLLVSRCTADVCESPR